MTFNEYQAKAKRTAKNLNLTEFGLGLGGEAGEAIDIIKKVEFHGHTLDVDKLTKELGDAIWYIAMIAETIGVSMLDVAEANIKKLEERYPNGFNSERSKNRTDCNECELNPAYWRSEDD